MAEEVSATPGYHETHMYCPKCSFVFEEQVPPAAPAEAQPTQDVAEPSEGRPDPCRPDGPLTSQPAGGRNEAGADSTSETLDIIDAALSGEVARQSEFGMSPSYRDFAIAVAEALTVTTKGGDAHATRAEAVQTGQHTTAPLDTSTSEPHFQSVHVEGVVKIVEEAISADASRMIAWKAYQQTEEWVNTRHWARHSEHVEYSLWAAFEAGFRAALEDKP